MIRCGKRQTIQSIYQLLSMKFCKYLMTPNCWLVVKIIEFGLFHLAIPLFIWVTFFSKTFFDFNFPLFSMRFISNSLWSSNFLVLSMIMAITHVDISPYWAQNNCSTNASLLIFFQKKKKKKNLIGAKKEKWIMIRRI